MTATPPLALQLFERARQLHQFRMHAEARQTYLQAIALAPNDPHILFAYAELAAETRSWEEAANTYRRIGELRPNSNYEIRLGVCLYNLGKYSEALPWFRKFNRKHPDDGAALMQMGSCLGKLGRWDDAIAALERALALSGDHPEIHEDLLTSYLNAGLQDKTEALLARSLALFPGNPAIHSLAANHYFKRGDYRAGYEHQKKRWPIVSDRRQSTRLPCPEWDGAPFAGTLLIAAEQALGDEVMFSSMFGDLVAMNQRAIIECDPRLIPLFQRSFPSLGFVPRGGDALLEACTNAEDFRKLDAGDLGFHFRRGLELFPARRSWLAPCPDKVAKLQARYREQFGDRPRVGISWTSRRPGYVIKGIELGTLLPMLRTPDCVFVNLQYSDVGETLEQLRRKNGVEIYRDPEIDTTKDIDALCAQIAVLDLVVTTSNVTIHLAGAIGKESWLMLPQSSPLSWYWGYAGDRSPWYPALTLIRNDNNENWSDFGTRMAKRFRNWCSSRNESGKTS